GVDQVGVRVGGRWQSDRGGGVRALAGRRGKGGAPMSSAGKWARVLPILVFAAIVAALVAPTTSADAPLPSICTSSIASNFNGTSIPARDYVWFNSVFKPKGVPSSGTTTIQLMSATAIFRANGTDYTVWLPPAEITF